MDEPKSYDDKLARILREASTIFAEKGYHQASIRDIAAATGASLSGLYYYFKSKEELLFLIQSHCFETILERFRRDASDVDDPRARLRIFIRNHLRFFANNMAEMKVLSHEAESLTGAYREKITAVKREYTKEAGRIVASLRLREGVDGRVATFSLFGMMNWIYNWYRPGRDVPPERLTEEMTHLFLEGFLSAPPPGGAPARDDGDPSIWRRAREVRG